MFELLNQPFIISALVVSLVMGLLLSYLGVHVVRRGIVFVDLALGQISMLGVAFAAFIETEPFLISIVFTMAGAFLLSFINVKDPRLKAEALIGIVYAVASAVTVLLISKAPHGDADISEVLFGSLFTVTNEQLMIMAIVFAAIGLLHFIFRTKFFDLTQKFQNHQAEDIGKFNFWNFTFYLTIGLAIVLAVRAGGVIPVFSYLIVPPVAAIMFSKRNSLVIILSIILSAIGSFFGIYFSVQFDFPAGSSIVAMLGVIFTVAIISNMLNSSRNS
ncbi:MAG: metal ABC transporter permease [Calditrichaeota bacterium]|nr:metal ABC transporter permease [Calditrichota bacterium]